MCNVLSRCAGLLEVWAWKHDSSRTLLESVSGDHGDAWHKLQLAITSTTLSGPFQVPAQQRASCQY
jgi:hypothetical protein